MKYRITTGVSIIMLGVLKLTDSLRILTLNDELILGMALIIFGIPTVYFSLSDGKRSLLFAGAVIFFTGIVLWITAKYDVINTFGFIFTSILFITGGSFILLFIENTKQKIFLYSGLLLVFLAYFSTNLFKDWGIIYSAEVFFKNFSGIISIVLFLGGLFFFLFRERE